MELIKGKCPECGGILNIYESQNIAICPFCNMPYIVEKAISNYNINEVKIQHASNINAQIVNIDSKETDRMFDSANTLLNIGEYEKAYLLYQNLINTHASDYKLWLNLVLSITKDFSYLELNKLQVNQIQKYFQNAVNIAKIDISETTKFNDYIEKVKAHQKMKKNKYIENKNEQQKLIKKINKLKKRFSSFTMIQMIGWATNIIIFIFSLIDGHFYMFTTTTIILIGIFVINKSVERRIKEYINKKNKVTKEIKLYLNKFESNKR